MTDHLTPHKGDKDLFVKMGNHIPLCHKCHNTVTSKFDRNSRGTEEEVREKVAWLNHQRGRHEILRGVKFPSVKVLRYED